jgi:hypothetical protein
MPVVAFTSFIVEAKPANAVDHIGGAVLELMLTARYPKRNTPDHDIDKASLRQNPPFSKQPGCTHVGLFTNTPRFVKTNDGWRRGKRPYSRNPALGR